MKLFATAFAAASLAALPAWAQEGNADHGKKLFNDIGCYQCHGKAGQGAAMTGPRLSNTQLPMEGFLHQLREPLNQMPPYEAAVLSDKDAADIFAYLQSMPKPPDAKSLPLLMSMGSR